MRTILSAIVLLLYVATEGMAQNISFKTEELKRVAAELSWMVWTLLRLAILSSQRTSIRLLSRRPTMVWWSI